MKQRRFILKGALIAALLAAATACGTNKNDDARTEMMKEVAHICESAGQGAKKCFDDSLDLFETYKSKMDFTVAKDTVISIQSARYGVPKNEPVEAADEPAQDVQSEAPPQK